MFYIWFPGFLVPCIMVLCGALRLVNNPLEKRYVGVQREEGNCLYQKSIWQVGCVLLAICFMTMRSVRLMDAPLQKCLLAALIVIELLLFWSLRYYVGAMMGKPCDSVMEKAYAKLNLTLEIDKKRPDGYHDLRSVMTCCDVCDILTVEKSDEISMTCNDDALSCDESNLCIRAACEFFKATGIDGGCTITLEKVIPMQAGLGGGSADAAAVLRALRRIYAPKLEDRQLEKMAEELGSDVPFCVRSETSLCEGRGEVLKKLAPLPKLWYVIAKPDVAYSTGGMYAALDVSTGERCRTTDAMVDAIEKKKKKGIFAAVNNDFYLALPEDSPVPDILEKLRELNAKAVAMSGSGSAVFGVYDNRYKARMACMLLQEQDYRTFCGKGV